jgi:hypothetical protein
MIESLGNECFASLTKLHRLHLQVSRLKAISLEVFSKLDMLELVMMGYNPIVTIEQDAFPNMESSDEDRIYLDHNQVESIQTGSFSNSNDLIILHLSDNQLKILQAGVHLMDWNLLHTNKVINLCP